MYLAGQSSHPQVRKRLGIKDSPYPTATLAPVHHHHQDPSSSRPHPSSRTKPSKSLKSTSPPSSQKAYASTSQPSPHRHSPFPSDEHCPLHRAKRTIPSSISIHFSSTRGHGWQKVNEENTYANMVDLPLVVAEGGLGDGVFVVRARGRFHAGGADVGGAAALFVE